MKKPSKDFPKPDYDDGYIHLCTCGHPEKQHKAGLGACIASDAQPGIGKVLCSCPAFKPKKKKGRAR